MGVTLRLLDRFCPRCGRSPSLTLLPWLPSHQHGRELQAAGPLCARRRRPPHHRRGRPEPHPARDLRNKMQVRRLPCRWTFCPAGALAVVQNHILPATSATRCRCAGCSAGGLFVLQVCMLLPRQDCCPAALLVGLQMRFVVRRCAWLLQTRLLFRKCAGLLHVQSLFWSDCCVHMHGQWGWYLYSGFQRNWVEG